MKSITLLLTTFLITKGTLSQNHYAFVTLAAGEFEHHAYLSNFGKITYTEKFDEKIYPLSEGLGMIKKDGKCGYIDPNGNIIIPVIYSDAEKFSDGFAAVELDGKWGYINKKNEFVIKPTLTSNKPFNEKIACYIDRSKIGNNMFRYIDTTGNFINSDLYINANNFNEECGWAKEIKTEKWGCVNTKGKYIIQPMFDRVTNFKNGRCWVQIDKKWGYISKKGEYIAEPIYEDTNNELNGYTWVLKGGMWGMLDSTGKIVIPLAYKNTLLYGLKSAFSYVKFGTPSNGLIPYISGVKVGYYDLSFKTIVPPTFDEATNFVDGVAAVKLKSKWGIIDATGKLICDYRFKEAKYLGYGLFYSEERNNDIMVFDKTGNVVFANNLLRISNFE